MRNLPKFVGRGLLHVDWKEGAPYFLILGTSRSGTSLVSAALNAHSGVVVTSEVFRDEILLGRDDQWSVQPRANRLAGYLNAVGDLARLETVGKWGTKITTEVLFYGAARTELDRGEAVAELLARLPRVPIVFVLRDGRSVVASKMSRAGDSVEKSCRHWVLSVEIWETLKALSWPMATIRFEDLVQSPEEELRSFCGRLGLDFESGMLNSTDSTFLLPEYRRDYFDAAASKPPAAAPEVLSQIRDAMERLGYC